MNREKAISIGDIEIEELAEIRSVLIVGSAQEAEKLVSRLVELRRNKGQSFMTVVVDGACVKPQQKFAAMVNRELDAGNVESDLFMADIIEHDARMAVEAGLLIEILVGLVREVEQREEAEHDVEKEKRAIEKITNYQEWDMDKVSGAVTGLGYLERQLDLLGLDAGQLIILNFDRLANPIYGPFFDKKIAEKFLRVVEERVGVLMFAEKAI